MSTDIDVVLFADADVTEAVFISEILSSARLRN
jgi:hypothetical protein